jgi:hypothetical protein
MGSLRHNHPNATRSISPYRVFYRQLSPPSLFGLDILGQIQGTVADVFGLSGGRFWRMARGEGGDTLEGFEGGALEVDFGEVYFGCGG